MGQGGSLDRWPNLREAAYGSVLERMQTFTETRTPQTPDVFWAVEHLPVFTLGVAGLLAHIHHAGDIPVVKTDRGGQVTYHGPGQVVIYTLIDLRRLGVSVRELVNRIEEGVLRMVRDLGVRSAQRVAGAPGIYLPQETHTADTAGLMTGAGKLEVQGLQAGPGALKIASLGLKVRKGCCYHGVALNLALDHGPFQQINPCGYPGLGTTDLRAQGIDLPWQTAADMLIHHLHATLYLRESAHHA